MELLGKGPGKVVGIWTAPEHGGPSESHDSIEAVAGQGLAGDRNYGRNEKPGRHLTLVTQEAIDTLADQHGIELEPGGTRRNVVTAGIDLNELVGVRFRVGDVEVEGVKLCHPCQYLEELNQVPGLQDGLSGYGGLRAHILTSGTISVGDTVAEVPQ